MSNIKVLGGVSVPYKQDAQTKKWSGAVGHAWKISNSYVKAFALEADKKIKNRPKNHGTVSYPPKYQSLASELEIHLNPNNNVNFLDFIKSVQSSNSISLETSRAQSKLVLIFLKYRKTIASNDGTPQQSKDILLVMLLKDKSALRFEVDGSPKGTEIIDFDDVMQAAIIDINEFSQAIKRKADLDISFINGTGGTTNYFIDFFDADDVIKNKDSVSNVLKALDDFSSINKLSRSQKALCDSKIKAFIDKNERYKIPTKLEELSSIIYSVLKIDAKLKIKKNTFVEYVQKHNYKVNEEFNLTKKERETLEFISFETDVGSLKLKKSVIKNKGDITFNVNSKELTIKTKISDPEIIKALKKLQ
ncbi:nucleoid-associated protein [Thalassotalea piscium]